MEAGILQAIQEFRLQLANYDATVSPLVTVVGGPLTLTNCLNNSCVPTWAPWTPWIQADVGMFVAAVSQDLRHHITVPTTIGCRVRATGAL